MKTCVVIDWLEFTLYCYRLALLQSIQMWKLRGKSMPVRYAALEFVLGMNNLARACFVDCDRNANEHFDFR